LHCAYCQNWVTSQALRDPAALAPPRDVEPDDLAVDAVRQGARVVVSTYNEPLITVEWGVEVFKAARARGLATGFVSNGNGTPQVIQYLAPWIDLYKVDLKSFDDKQYRKLGGRLQPILDSIRELHARGLWVEIVTLLVPGFNDSEAEITKLTEFIASVSLDLPWHVTAFHQDYHMVDPMDTTPAQLSAAAAIGKRAGLRYVYAGNQPGMVGDLEHTRCASCQTLLVERHGYYISRYHVTELGTCPSCHAAVPGRWDHAFAGQITTRPFQPHDRTRLRVI
jgi:pyruvate formate lyase activating enzyme